jgi:predicted transcriptional regulator
MVVGFLCKYKPRTAGGQNPWPTAYFIRTHLYSREQNWGVKATGDPMDQQDAIITGANPRFDLFQKNLDILVELGWIERFTDDQGAKRYRVTQSGEDGYSKLGKDFLQYADNVEMLSRRKDAGQPQ